MRTEACGTLSGSGLVPSVQASLIRVFPMGQSLHCMNGTSQKGSAVERMVSLRMQGAIDITWVMGYSQGHGPRDCRFVGYNFGDHARGYHPCRQLYLWRP